MAFCTNTMAHGMSEIASEFRKRMAPAISTIFPSIWVFDHTVLEAVGKVQARIEELRQAKGGRQQLELKFGDAIVGESPTGVSFPPLSPVRAPLGHQNIADSVVSC